MLLSTESIGGLSWHFKQQGVTTTRAMSASIATWPFTNATSRCDDHYRSCEVNVTLSPAKLMLLPQ